MDAAAQRGAIQHVAYVHRHHRQGGDPQRTAGGQHGGDHKLAGAGVNDAGEKQAFQRGETQPGGIESEGECHRKVADDDGETVFNAFADGGDTFR